ncbi:hypothetical protein N2488_10455 [SAR92 clade bacterium H231]|nr:hypothetical protein [SAR92 clade bacterium H231]
MSAINSLDKLFDARSVLSNVFPFLVGLGSAVYVKAFGTFGYSEPILVIYVLVVLLKEKRISAQYFKIMLASLAWLAGIFLSDLVNEVNVFDTLKLSGTVVLILLNILGYYFIISKSSRAAFYFILGNGISYLMQFYLLPPPLMAGEYGSNFNDNLDVKLTWVAITHFIPCLAVTSVLWCKGWKNISLLLILIASGGTLLLGSRAYFLIGIVTIFWLLHLKRRKPIFSKLKPLRRGRSTKSLASLVILLMLALLVSVYSYSFLASSGALGEYSQQKYVTQSQIQSLGLASGRVDFIEGLYAIYLNPILGYGSFASDNNGITVELFKLLGVTTIEARDGMPNHSHILGAWVYSGILALPFWLITAFYVWRLLLRTKDDVYTAIVIPYSLLFFWNFLFSPMGFRGEFCFIIAFAIHANWRSKKSAFESISLVKAHLSTELRPKGVKS